MEQAFWLQHWREGRIGFHQSKVLPLLQKHWPALALEPGSRVFVPLAGKTLDMAWLAQQGHRILAVELSPLAVQQFFAEHGWTPRTWSSRYGTHYGTLQIEVICGDAFGLDAQVLADCVAVYDRAALVALPPSMRQTYVHELMARLPSGCRGLLVTLEYPQHEMQGPPFSVPQAEVLERYAPHWDAQPLQRRDILAHEPGFAARGLTQMATAVYRLQRH